MKVVLIIQARMGSSRLPGKVMEDVIGEPMLAHVVERCRRASFVDEVVIATTTARRDDLLVALCQDRGWSCFRGSETNVLERYYQAAHEHQAEMVVRVTSDCPLIDPEVIDRLVRQMATSWQQVDFVTNMLRQSYPLGLAVEAMPIDTLTRMQRLSTTPYLREHVTTLAYERPELFLTENVCIEEDLSDLRWTVDFADDLRFVRNIFGHFGHNRFAWREVLNVLELRPDWDHRVSSVAGH